jgi:hypothetical protein
MRPLPQSWTVAMEATVFTGWIYDHLQPHAAALKVAHGGRSWAAEFSGTTGEPPRHCLAIGRRAQRIGFREIPGATRTASVRYWEEEGLSGGTTVSSGWDEEAAMAPSA